MEKRGAREVEAVSRLAFHGRNAPFDTPYTLAQGSHACGQRDARYRHRRNAIANRDLQTPALRHRALPNRSYGRLGPLTSRAGGRRVWSEGVVQQKEANQCAQWWRMLSSRANTGLHARRHAPRGVHRIAKNKSPYATASIGLIPQWYIASSPCGAGLQYISV